MAALEEGRTARGLLTDGVAWLTKHQCLNYVENGIDYDIGSTEHRRPKLTIRGIDQILMIYAKRIE